MSPYGETLSSTTSDPYAYAGLYRDTEYGGDAATFRNYTAEQSRWTRPDPYNGSYDVTNPQSMNRYVYAMNNPLAMTDPSGLDCVYDEGGNMVAILAGDCGSETDDGYYIDGTINTSSGITLNPDGSLTFGVMSPNGDFGVGAITGFGDSVFGSDSTGSWGNQTLLQQIFQGPESGVFVGADKTVHGLAIATAGVAAVPFVPTVVAIAGEVGPDVSRIVQQLGMQMLLNPKTWTTMGDFASGWSPSPPPATYAGYYGSFGSWLWGQRKQ